MLNFTCFIEGLESNWHYNSDIWGQLFIDLYAFSQQNLKYERNHRVDGMVCELKKHLQHFGNLPISLHLQTLIPKSDRYQLKFIPNELTINQHPGFWARCSRWRLELMVVRVQLLKGLNCLRAGALSFHSTKLMLLGWRLTRALPLEHSPDSMQLPPRFGRVNELFLCRFVLHVLTSG